MGARDTAIALLDTMRRTPMRRGDVPKLLEPFRQTLSERLTSLSLPASLAHRVSRQLVFKCDRSALADDDVRVALAAVLLDDLGALQGRHGLSLRQAVEVLPKLSAADIDAFVQELHGEDRTIARTILNAAAEAASPLETGRRYLRAYREVAAQVGRLDPSIARTLANATFTARTPRRKAVEHFTRFAEILRQLQDQPSFARRVAKAAFRTSDPVATAERIVRDYQRTVAQLTSSGIEPELARTVAQSTHFRASLGSQANEIH